jgi:hypothetical protein
MLNARSKGRPIPAPRPDEDFDAWLEAAAKGLGLRCAPFPAPLTYLKHVFDNRFYDASFEALWQYLEHRGLTTNTVTVVTSDHGMSLREHGESLYRHSGARPYEYLIRIPLVLRFPPGSEGAGLHRRYREAVSLSDLFPTLVDLAVGRDTFERDLPIRGQDLVLRLRNRSFEPYLVSEASSGPSSYHRAPDTLGYAKAVIAGDLKLLHMADLFRTPPGAPGWPINVRLGEEWPLASPRPPLDRLSEPLDQLYDLSIDPEEKRDLAAARPEDVRRLAALVRSWSCRSLPWGPAAPIWRGESLATLRSLGYVQ